MTVRDILEKMQEILEAAKAMPLSQSVLVNRAELLDLIQLLANSLPAEFDAARTIIVLGSLLAAGADRIKPIALETMREVKERVGLA